MTCEAAEHKHAYLIMAHDKPRQLEILLSLLDDPRNDIYLHLDSRLAIDLSAFSEQVCHSNLFFVERDAVRWGALFAGCVRAEIADSRSEQASL